MSYPEKKRRKKKEKKSVCVLVGIKAYSGWKIPLFSALSVGRYGFAQAEECVRALHQFFSMGWGGSRPPSTAKAHLLSFPASRRH